MIRFVFLVAAVLIAASGMAQDDSPEASPSGQNFFPCNPAPEPRSTHFKSIEREALRVLLDTCIRMNSQPFDSPEIFDDYGRFLERAVSETDFGSAELSLDVNDSVMAMSDALGGRLGGRLRTPSFEVIAEDFGEFNDNGGTFVFRASTIGAANFQPSDLQETACATTFGADSCLAVFDDLSDSINVYNDGYVSLLADKAEGDLAELSARWNRFFEESRTPTFIDLWLTSILERDRFRAGFPQGPPVRQYFALRPNVILMYHDGAPQGDQFVPGISLEWVGVNWWDESPIGIPFGFSVTSVYADVPEVDRTIGTGLTFHFDNNLTIGWARHGDENSYQVSADLLQLFKDTQSRFDDYKARFDAVFEQRTE